MLLVYDNLFHGHEHPLPSQRDIDHPVSRVVQNRGCVRPGAFIKAVRAPHGHASVIGDIRSRGRRFQPAQGKIRRQKGKAVSVEKAWRAIFRIKPAPGQANAVKSLWPSM